LVDFGFWIVMNLTAVLSSVDRPWRAADEASQLLRVLRTFGKAAILGLTLRNREEIRAKISQELLEFDSNFFQDSLRQRQGILAQFERGDVTEDDLPRDILVELLSSQDEAPIAPDVLMKEIGFSLLAPSLCADQPAP
jgi:hypothetical protein